MTITPVTLYDPPVPTFDSPCGSPAEQKRVGMVELDIRETPSPVHSFKSSDFLTPVWATMQRDDSIEYVSPYEAARTQLLSLRARLGLSEPDDSPEDTDFFSAKDLSDPPTPQSDNSSTLSESYAKFHSPFTFADHGNPLGASVNDPSFQQGPAQESADYRSSAYSNHSLHQDPRLNGHYMPEQLPWMKLNPCQVHDTEWQFRPPPPWAQNNQAPEQWNNHHNYRHPQTWYGNNTFNNGYRPDYRPDYHSGFRHSPRNKKRTVSSYEYRSERYPPLPSAQELQSSQSHTQRPYVNSEGWKLNVRAERECRGMYRKPLSRYEHLKPDVPDTPEVCRHPRAAGQPMANSSSQEPTRVRTNSIDSDYFTVRKHRQEPAEVVRDSDQSTANQSRRMPVRYLTEDQQKKYYSLAGLKNISDFYKTSATTATKESLSFQSYIPPKSFNEQPVNPPTQIPEPFFPRNSKIFTIVKKLTMKIKKLTPSFFS